MFCAVHAQRSRSSWIIGLIFLLFLPGCFSSPATPALRGRITYDDGKAPVDAKRLYDVKVYAASGDFQPPDPNSIMSKRLQDGETMRGIELDFFRNLSNLPEGAIWSNGRLKVNGKDFTIAETTMDVAGNYVFENLPEGICYVTVVYHLRNSDPAAREATPRQVYVRYDKTIDLNIYLSGFDFIDL